MAIEQDRTTEQKKRKKRRERERERHLADHAPSANQPTVDELFNIKGFPDA